MNAHKKTYSSLFNTPSFRLKSTDKLTCQGIKEWQVLGLLDSIQPIDKKKSTRYYSLIDLIWLSIIVDLKDLSLENSAIKKGKEVLFAAFDTNTKQPTVLEHYVRLIFETSLPIFIVLCDSRIYIFSDVTYVEHLKSNTIQNHICIPLHKQVNEVLNQQFVVRTNFDKLLGLSSQEIQVLQIIRNKTLKTLYLTYDKGEIQTVDCVEKIEAPFEIQNILKQKSHQSLEIKQHDGEIVSVFRTSKHKII